jgi:hypothetical protein
LKAFGHVYGDAVNTQKTSWDHVEVRVDDRCCSKEDLLSAGYHVGDICAFDAVPEISSTGFINARYLDDKAGAAILLAVAKSFTENSLELSVDCHLLFTIFKVLTNYLISLRRFSAAFRISTSFSSSAIFTSNSVSLKFSMASRRTSLTDLPDFLNFPRYLK